MAKSVDFYRPAVLPDPSLRVLERRGIWGFGGIAVIGILLVLAAFLCLDKVMLDPLGPVEAAIWRDWDKSPRELPGLERREILPPAFFRSLRIWSGLFDSQGMFRVHSALWTLVLIAIVFRLGTVYFSPQVGGTAAALLAVSPLLVATSKEIGPATLAAVLLMIHFISLLGLVYRESSRVRWGLYAGTALLAILAHPLAAWVVIVQALATIAWGPREEPRGFYGRMVGGLLFFVIVAWVWGWMTRPVDPLLLTDWRAGYRIGWGRPIQVLGAAAFWGARIFPDGFFWTLGSLLLVLVPLLVGALSIRQHKPQELSGFFLLCGAAPVIVILLAPSWLIANKSDPADLLVLTLAPLSVWAAVALRLGLNGYARTTLTVVLIGGGLLVSLWGSRAEIAPPWTNYETRIQNIRAAGSPVVESHIRPLADYKMYLDRPLQIPPIRSLMSARTRGKGALAILEATTVRYRNEGPDDSQASKIREWLEENSENRELFSDRYFRLSIWEPFDAAALRRDTDESTFSIIQQLPPE